MNNNYRIHTNIGSDTVLNVKFKQDMDFLEVLTLKISQEDTYRLDNSNYGVIVGRVLANDAFGVPNAKLSVFIELNEEDEERTDIFNIYNFKTVNDTNNKNIKYNLLPDYKDDECYRVVGSFPNKRLVLDDNTVLEVFDKYYKYTTVTNNAGDYMIYGVPTGNTTLHVDVDLSDIGVLSQKPRDFMYKGYNEKQFDNANQFKESTNLSNLSQIISQTQGVYVYPFFGEEGSEDIAITRCDVQIQYKFEPTCVFMGSIITDSYGNALGDLCNPSRGMGRNSDLVTGFGTIEMIRKTVDGLTEEYQIQGNQLIDGDGVWCYQIPMNLDYVGTDECGNIVATDNPSKGIPTRTRVRFRVSLTEMENDAISRHRAKYLIPNNPKIISNEALPKIQDCAAFEKHYNFGSSTQDEDYRDLFWNKVYSVKNYVPRLQNTAKSRTYYYTGLRTSNDYGSKNPIPFNKVRFKIPFSYAFLCIVIKIVIMIVTLINSTIVCPYNAAVSIFRIIPFVGKKIARALSMDCISFGTSLTANDEDDVEYYPGCYCKSFGECQTPGCTQRAGHFSDLFDIVEQVLAEDYDVVHLDFFNDWLNGCIYAPLWFWKKQKKKSYFFGLFRSSAKNRYCDCDINQKRFKLVDTCTMSFSGPSNDGGDKWDKNSKQIFLHGGLIKNIKNKDGLNLYYYSPGNIIEDKPKEGTRKKFARLFATDIILLGTFNTCDMDGMPQVYDRLPATTANIPGIKRATITNTDGDDPNVIEGSDEELMTSTVIETGMDWLHGASRQTPKYKNGLLFGIDCTSVQTKPKTCINAQRLSELGVSLDATYSENYAPSKGKTEQVEFEADGIVTKIELDDYETRAMFATLNHNGLDVMKRDENTGYDVYDLRYIYSVDFDGRFDANLLKGYGYKDINDLEDKDYLLFKYGSDYENKIIHNYTLKNPETSGNNDFFPLYNNSFYFYFGLNEGKTAIDKFRTKFVSKCFQNKKYPFNIDINTKLGASCIKDASECPVIEIKLDNIEKPYSYTLTIEDTNEKVISETGITLDNLMFGVAMDDKCKNYTLDDNGTYIAISGKKYKVDGRIHSLNKCGNFVKKIDDNFVINEGDTDIWLLQNGIYNISITDNNGKTQKETISLMQQPIDLIYETIELGNAFYPKESETLSVGNYSEYGDFKDKQTYGEFNISGVTIDGDSYDMKREPSYRGKNDYNELIWLLHVVKHNDTKYSYDVKLKISVKSLYFEQDLRRDDFNTILRCCNNPTVKDIWSTDDAKFEGGVIKFKVWVPANFQVTVIQICNGEESNNTSSYLISVPNGKPFEAYIDDVPMRFIQGSYASGNTLITNWANVKDENSSLYTFPSVGQNEVIWSNFIDYTTIYDGTQKQKYCDAETKYNALCYKFNSIFKLARAAYFTDNGYNYFSLSASGGKKKLVLQGYYPAYSTFGSLPLSCDNLEFSKLTKYTLDSLQPYAACDYSHPNIVYGQNYQHYCKSQYEKITETILNPLFIYDNSFNYFAAFTNSAQKPYDMWPNRNGVKPILKQNNKPDEFDEKPIDKTKDVQNWCKTLFIDRRMGYEVAIVTSTNFNEIDGVLKNGRISIHTIGGMDMAYDYNDGDFKYNFIGEGEGSKLEYYYKKDEIVANANDIKVYYKGYPQRYFYNVSLTTNGYDRVDLTRAMKNTEIETTSLSVEANYSGVTPTILKKFPAELYNGPLFNGTTPIERYTDVNNIKNVNGFGELEISSAGYPSSIKSEAPKDNSTEIKDRTIRAFCQPTDVIDFEFLCGGAYTLDGNNAETCAEKSDFNILYNSGKEEEVYGSSATTTYKPFAMRFSAKAQLDNLTNEMHKLYKPKLLLCKNKKALEDVLNFEKQECQNLFVSGDTFNIDGVVVKDFALVNSDEINSLIFDDSTSKFYKSREDGTDLNSIEHEKEYRILSVHLPFSNKYGISWLAKLYTIDENCLWGMCANRTKTTNDVYGKYGISIMDSENTNDEMYTILYSGKEYINDDETVLLKRHLKLYDFSNINKVNNFTCIINMAGSTSSFTSNQKGYSVKSDVTRGDIFVPEISGGSSTRAVEKDVLEVDTDEQGGGTTYNVVENVEVSDSENDKQTVTLYYTINISDIDGIEINDATEISAKVYRGFNVKNKQYFFDDVEIECDINKEGGIFTLKFQTNYENYSTSSIFFYIQMYINNGLTHAFSFGIKDVSFEQGPSNFTQGKLFSSPIGTKQTYGISK